MSKENGATQLDRKWVIEIERWAFAAPFLITLTLLLGLKEPLQPLWLFSLCYAISYVATYFFGGKGAFFSSLISIAFFYPVLPTWDLWHIAAFGSAYLALFVMGMSKDEMHKTLFQYHRERQSLATVNEQISIELEADRLRYKEQVKEQRTQIENAQREIEDLKRQKRSLEDMTQVQEQNIDRYLAEKKSVEEQLFLEYRDKHRTQGIIDQLRAHIEHFEEVAKQESQEGKLHEQINQLRVEKFELSILESSHLTEKLRMEDKLKESEKICRELMQELDQLQKGATFTSAENSTDEVALAYTQLRKQFEEKRSQLLAVRKDFFNLEGRSEALEKLKALEEWNHEAQLFSVISLQNELIAELEVKDKEIESLEELLTAGLQGKKDRPRLPTMKKLQTRSKRKKS